MEVARFLTKLVFCMFASDVELLPKNIITTIVDNYRSTTATVVAGLRAREAPCAQRTVVLHHTMPPQRPSLSGRSSLLPSRENRIPTRRRGKTAGQPSFDNRQSSIPSATRLFHSAAPPRNLPICRPLTLKPPGSSPPPSARRKVSRATPPASPGNPLQQRLGVLATSEQQANTAESETLVAPLLASEKIKSAANKKGWRHDGTPCAPAE